MFEFRIETMKEADVGVFLDMIPYISPKIQKIEKGEGVVRIICDPEEEQGIRAELDQLASYLKSLRDSEIETKVIADYTENIPKNQTEVFSQLVEERQVRELAPGAFSYAGIFLKVYEYFDKKIKEYGKQTFIDAIEEVYPVLFPVEEYIKGRYFENFPHHMMFQTKLNNRMETYEKFMRQKGTCNCMDEIFADSPSPKNVLRHATCAPVYPSLKDCILKEHETKVFSVSGRCFRNEESNIKELSRLNEFYMKEFVFVGDAEDISSYIERAQALTKFWIDTFQLNAKCETANDSFFASSYKKLKYFQLIGNSKLEYKFLLPGSSEYISCCSANYHRTHFSKPYNIKNEKGDYCYTACFAFGIDRLTYAFLSQKGLNTEAWEKETLEELEKYVDIRG